MNAIADFLYGILEFITGIVKNHGVSIIIFTILMRLVCVPFDYKSRKGMRKMAAIQPKLAELQRKYGNDKQKFQQKQAELMRKEHYNPLSSCLPMLLTWPLMIAMFSAMRMIANEQLAMQALRYLVEDPNPIKDADVFLWVKNIWMTDSPFAATAPDANSLSMLTADVWVNAFKQLLPEQMETVINASSISISAELQDILNQMKNIFSAAGDSVSAEQLAIWDQHALHISEAIFNAEQYKQSAAGIVAALQQDTAYQAAISTVPGWTNVSFILFSITVFHNFNGLLILPALAGITQVLQTKFNPQMKEQERAQVTPNGQKSGAGNFMKYFFPILSVFFCLTSNAGFALYWVTSTVVMWVMSIIMTKILEKQDAKKEAAIAGEGKIK